MLGSLQFPLWMCSSSLPWRVLCASGHGIFHRENIAWGSCTAAEKRAQSSWDLWEQKQLFFFSLLLKLNSNWQKYRTSWSWEMEPRFLFAEVENPWDNLNFTYAVCLLLANPRFFPIQDLVCRVPVAHSGAVPGMYRLGMLQITQLVEIWAKVLRGSKSCMLECLNCALVLTGATLRPLIQQ